MTPDALLAKLYALAPEGLRAWMDERPALIRTAAEQAIAAAAPPVLEDVQVEVVYDPGEGLFLRSDRQASDTIKALRDARTIPYFRWWGGRKVWGVNGSKDQAARYPLRALERIAQAFRDEGLTARAVLEGQTRSFRERVAEIEEQAEARAERLEERAARAKAEAHGAWDTSHQISQRFELGQPILVGHHSEAKARRDQERMHDLTRKSIALDEKAGYYAAAAERAERRAGYGSDPRKAVTRTNTLLPQVKKLKKTLAEYDAHEQEKGALSPRTEEHREQLRAMLAQAEEELEYWRETQPAAVAALYERGDRVTDLVKELKRLKKAIGAAQVQQRYKTTGARKVAAVDVRGGTPVTDRYGTWYSWGFEVYVQPTGLTVEPHNTSSVKGLMVRIPWDTDAATTVDNLIREIAPRFASE